MQPFKLFTLTTVFILSLLSTMAQAAPNNPQLSVQLWSIKDDVSKDFEGTLKQLSAMGFQGVEFAGNFGKYANDAPGLKIFLTKNHLKVSGAHVPFEKFNSENFSTTVAFYKTLGCKYLIIPMDKRAATLEGAKQVADDLTALAAKLKPFGLQTGYHNHKQEMVDLNGNTSWDVIAKNTPASVVLQQDVGWTEAAGKDPVTIVNHYPGRILTTHYKADAPGNTENPIIGLDTTDWKALITANRNSGTKWFVIEQEVYPEGMTPMQSVEASLKGLKKILAEMKTSK